MHRIDGADNVANHFDEGPPGTVITDDWLNDVQETLANYIESVGITLVKGTYTQLTSAVAATITALKAAANTWSALQTMTSALVVTRGTAGHAVTATGNDTGAGVAGTGGANGNGVIGQAGSSATYGVRADGVSGGLGLLAASSATNVSVAKINGYVDFANATRPSSSTAFANPTLTPANLVAAWAVVQTDGAGNATVLRGANVTAAAISGTSVRLTFGTTFPSSLIGPTVTVDQNDVGSWGSVSTTQVDIVAVGTNLSTTARILTAVVMAP